jgi:FKBP-type peptidyl-prolyl cis-trans isomerase FkpA
MKTSLLIKCVLLLLVITSCKNTSNKEKEPVVKNPKQYEDELQKANQLLAYSEDVQINDIVERMGWPMQTSGTGLRYWIYSEGGGRKTERLSIVRFNFKVELINGFVCYDSQEDGFQEIQLGKSTAPSGLEEGLAMMREGDRAKLILPSHLAFGLLGDQDKIPTKAILIYDVEVIQVRDI